MLSYKYSSPSHRGKKITQNNGHSFLQSFVIRESSIFFNYHSEEANGFLLDSFNCGSRHTDGALLSTDGDSARQRLRLAAKRGSVSTVGINVPSGLSDQIQLRLQLPTSLLEPFSRCETFMCLGSLMFTPIRVHDVIHKSSKLLALRLASSPPPLCFI